jgi:hypothetical protein
MLAFGQAASQPKPLMAEDVFKKGLSQGRFMIFAGGLEV